MLHCAGRGQRARADALCGGQGPRGPSIAVTLLAVGVERDAIVADYLESNATHRRYKVRRSGTSPRRDSPEVMELLGPLFDARAEYLSAAFETIEETWGGVDRYLERGLGLTPALRDRLRERLLD